jgi:hypothetical protein
LSEQIEQCGFDGRARVNRRAKIEGLLAAPAGIAGSEFFPDGIENVVVGGD